MRLSMIALFAILAAGPAWADCGAIRDIRPKTRLLR